MASENPKDLATRSAQQAKHSANNAGRAVEAGAEQAVDAATTPTAKATFNAALMSLGGGVLIGFGVQQVRNAIATVRDRKVG